MAMSWSPAMLRAVRGLPQAVLLPDNPLRLQPCGRGYSSPRVSGGGQQEEKCAAPSDWATIGGPPHSRLNHSAELQAQGQLLPYWLGAEARLKGRLLSHFPPATANSWDSAAGGCVAQKTGTRGISSARQRVMLKSLRGFGSQAGALQKEEEETLPPAWRRRQDIVNGFISEGHPSQTIGGSSRCRSITFGCATMQGKKETMDDRLTVQFSVRGNRHLGFFGAFDGHGGWTVADYAAHNLHRHVLNSPLVGSSLQQAMIDAYARTDKEVLTYPGRLPGEYSPGLVGSTATTAVVDLGRAQLVIANVGDSRGVLCKGGRAVRLTAEHTVAEESERDRIERNGGEVEADRLCGILNVSRALGDSDLKQWVISDPFVREFQLTSADEFIVLATDGLWDVLSNEGAVEIAQEAGDAQRAAQMLMEEAMMRRARDDVACLVVFFHWAR